VEIRLRCATIVRKLGFVGRINVNRIDPATRSLKRDAQGDPPMVPHRTSQFVLCLCVIAIGDGSSITAFGDNAALKPIADFIANDFPIDGAIASAGTDWRLETETDPNKNWWDFSYGGKIVPHSSEYGTRIRLAYTAQDGTNPDFASLFLAVDANKPDYYYARPTFRPEEPKVEISMSSTPISFPTSPCPKLEDFLNVVFERNITNWFPLVPDPTCDDSVPGKCPDVSGYPSKQTSQTNIMNFLYWNFNGKIHKIAGAVRLLINFCTDTPDNCKNNRQSNLGYLFIGFGGNGGAG
jgi:hypothetical protein